MKLLPRCFERLRLGLLGHLQVRFGLCSGAVEIAAGGCHAVLRSERDAGTGIHEREQEQEAEHRKSGTQNYGIHGFVVQQVHEYERDNAGLDSRDQDGGGDIRFSEIELGHQNGDTSENEQRDEREYVLAPGVAVNFGKLGRFRLRGGVEIGMVMAHG